MRGKIDMVMIFKLTEMERDRIISSLYRSHPKGRLGWSEKQFPGKTDRSFCIAESKRAFELRAVMRTSSVETEPRLVSKTEVRPPGMLTVHLAETPGDSTRRRRSGNDTNSRRTDDTDFVVILCSFKQIFFVVLIS